MIDSRRPGGPVTSILGTEIESLEESDFERLRDDGYAERKVIEYKRALPSANDAGRKEFLADVSSFANSAGGLLLYGIEEDNGAPTGIPGVDIEDPDAEQLRWDQITRAGIAPRLPRIDLRALPLASGRYVLAIKVPRSWAAPHMVTFKNASRFYARTSAGKYQLDVGEIRTSVLGSASATDRLRAFRAERISSILGGETPVSLPETAKLVLHLVPLDAFTPGRAIDLKRAMAVGPALLSGGSSDSRYNLDGLVAYYDTGLTTPGYAQIFRDGSIEAVDTLLLKPRGDRPGIPSEGLEVRLTKTVVAYLDLYRSLGVEPPVYLMVSLLGVRGYIMHLPQNMFPPIVQHSIERDLALVPEVVIDELDSIRAGEFLKPVFEAVWNATGSERPTWLSAD